MSEIVTQTTGSGPPLAYPPVKEQLTGMAVATVAPPAPPPSRR
jgi:hypothetical protein